MHTQTKLLFAFVAGIILFGPAMPAILRADFIPEPIAPTFENLQTLTLTLEAGGALLAADGIPTGSGMDVGYRIGYTDRFFSGSGGGLSPAQKEEVFQAALADMELVLELWNGEPFTPGAEVEETWELPPAAEGTVPMAFTGPGPHFVVAYFTNNVRDREAYCAKYGRTPEDCADGNLFPQYARAETQSYFQRPPDSETPWSDAYPNAFAGARLTVAGTPGVSNVLFLPGIKGTRLYAEGEKLWEPSGSGAIERLFLDAEGRSADPGVYARTGDVLSQALSHKFYASFFDDLDTAKEGGIYGEHWQWESAAYDWRLSLTDLAIRGARYDDRIYYGEANGIPYIEQLLRDLAATSVTGKVTLIAHSNGGLVAKALMRKFGDGETAALIDKVVFVGVPQSGAPQALAAALFGYGEALPFDSCADRAVVGFLCSLLVDRGTARVFAGQSPMTYHLLPSGAYFDAIRDNGHPPVMWSGLTFFKKEQERYGAAAETADELYDFALARDGGRQKPTRDDTGSANVLSGTLIAYARDIHAGLDAWTPPDGLEVYQIGGWGRDTMSGIQFYEKPGILGLFGGREAFYRPAFVEDGDGVVPTQSAFMMRGAPTYWIDLKRAGNGHADLLEIPDVRSFVRSILTNVPELPSLLSTGKPEAAPARRIMFFLHSPLTLGFRDEAGKYSGMHEDGSVEESVPDTEYGTFGEVQYLLAPAGHPYELIMHGLAKGTFTLEILERVGNNVATTSSIVNVPTTAATVATLSVPAATGNIGNLEVDVNGDGVVDLSIRPKLGEPVVLAEPEPEPNPEPIPPDPSSNPPPPDPATTTPPAPPAEPPSTSTSTSGSAHSRSSTNDDSPPDRTVGSSSAPLSMNGSSTATTTTFDGSTGASSSSQPQEAGTLAYADTATTGIPIPRAQTASAYDAFTNLPHGWRNILWLPLLLLLLVLLLWLLSRPRKKEEVDSD